MSATPANEQPKEPEVRATASHGQNEPSIVIWPSGASQPLSEQDSSIGDDIKERHNMYIPSSQALESDSEAQNGRPSVLFEKLPKVPRPPRTASSSDQAWKTLTSVPSRNGQDSMPERTGHGRRASVLSMKTDGGVDRPRRLSYSSYNDEPNTDNSDVIIGQGTTDLETGARVPHEVKDTSSLEDKEADTIIVEWDGDDKELGTTWSLTYRAYVAILVGALSIASTMTSSLPSNLMPKTAAHFGVSEEVIKLSTFIFLGGYCFGPLLWAPYSELYGVRWPFIFSMAGLTIFNMACALAPNIGGLIAFRFLAGVFASCPLVVGGGAMANIWPKELLGLGMCVFSMSPMAGPACGPVIGGYVAVVKSATWRWGFWACTILSGFLTLLTFLTLKETNQVITLKKKAQRLRKETGDNRYKAPVELRTIDLRELATRWLILPILMFVYEPMLQAITMYMSFVYGVLYLFFEAFPVVFGAHGLNNLQTGLTFLGFLLGCIIGGLFYIFVENPRYVKLMRANPQGAPPPEERLMVCMYGAPILVISLFWFGWTSYPWISIWSPIAAACFYGIAMFFVYVRVLC